MNGIIWEGLEPWTPKYAHELAVSA